MGLRNASLALILLAATAAAEVHRTPIVSRIAGGEGAADGIVANARFFYPSAVASDILGNLYVADTANHVIRRIDPSGTVITVAGLSGSPGGEDGPPGEARFRFPSAIAVGDDGAIYVADTGNHAIRRVLFDGTVETFAGKTGVGGDANGIGSAARFTSPHGLTVDSSGVIYVADTANHAIRRIDPDRRVSTLAGRRGVPGRTDGMAESARFTEPFSIALGADGGLIVTEYGSATVRLVNGFGNTATARPCAEVEVHPVSIAVTGDGTMVFSDRRHVIRIAAPDGECVTIGGEGVRGYADGGADTSRFDYPEGVAIGGGGTIYVADVLNHSVRSVSWKLPRRRGVRRP
jgi:streptogramin lyase